MKDEEKVKTMIIPMEEYTVIAYYKEMDGKIHVIGDEIINND